MFLQTLFSCIHCKDQITNKFFPLCTDCYLSLQPSPPLCPKCASPQCLQTEAGSCLRAWVPLAEDAGPASYHSLYLMVGPAHSILRKWKTHNGPSFDRLILRANALRLPELLDFVVPMPQRFLRSWRLGGNPAEKIARWIGSTIDRPVLHALLPPDGTQPILHQGGLTLEQRLRNRIRIRENPESVQHLRGKKILLVDDFLTTGRTMRTAATLLGRLGAAETHVFSLGVRPQFSSRLTKTPVWTALNQTLLLRSEVPVP